MSRKRIGLSLIILALLIPTIALGDVMIFFVAEPEVVVTRLGNLRARPNLGAGVKAGILESAIIVATDPDVTKVCYATLIPDNLLAVARTKPQFRGKGLNEVKANYPAIYNRIAQKVVRLQDNTVVRIDMATETPVGGTVLQQDVPLYTYFGFDPFTGELNK